MTKSLTPRRASVAVAVTVAALALTYGGLAFAGAVPTPSDLTGAQDVTPITYASHTGLKSAATTAGMTAPQVAHTILDQAGVDPAMTVSVGTPPAIAGMRPGAWLNFSVPVSGSGTAVQIRAAWTADLVQGAIADAFARNGLTPVTGSRITGVLSDGSTVDLGGGMGDVAAGQSFSDDNVATIEQRIKSALASSALQPVSIDVLHAAQPAPAVVVETDNPAAAAAAANSTINELFGLNPPLYEGYYFEIDDAQGSPVLVQSASFRTGSGRQWVDPRYAADSSLAHG
jgi:hypothetical protein